MNADLFAFGFTQEFAGTCQLPCMWLVVGMIQVVIYVDHEHDKACCKGMEALGGLCAGLPQETMRLKRSDPIPHLRDE